MKVLSGPYSSWEPPATDTAVTVGVFDGVHRGHRALIERLRVEAGALPIAVVTFDRHPASVVAPGSGPGLLTPPDHRLELLEGCGLDIVAQLEFNAETSKLAAETFVADVLIGALSARLLVAGDDFRFGLRGAGDVELLRALEGPLGFNLHVIEPVSDGSVISSTRIRNSVLTGDIDGAAALLGRNFSIKGIVVEGDGRGKSIGVPTANVEHHADQVLPGRGVYAVVTHFDGVAHPGVANVGVRPTFAGSRTVVEVHLLEFDGDLYGTPVEVEFRTRIRDEKKFADVDELVAQIRADIAAGASMLGVDPGPPATGS